MKYLFRSPGPFEIRRDIHLPKGEQSLRSIGDFCGIVATKSLLKAWAKLQADVPGLPDQELRLIPPRSVNMIHAPEVGKLFCDLPGGRHGPPARKKARTVVESINSLFGYTKEATHTIAPRNISEVRKIACTTGVRLYIAFDHEPLNNNKKPTACRDVTTSLGCERRSLQRLLKNNLALALDKDQEYGMPFAEIPHELANTTFETETGPKQTIASALTRFVTASLVEDKKLRLSAGHVDTGVFMLDPPYLTHKIQPAEPLDSSTPLQG